MLESLRPGIASSDAASINEDFAFAVQSCFEEGLEEGKEMFLDPVAERKAPTVAYEDVVLVGHGEEVRLSCRVGLVST